MKRMIPFSVASLCFVALVLSSFRELGFCKDEDFLRMRTQTTAGGIQDLKGYQNNAEIESMGRFAVEEHNKKENGVLVFARVVGAKEQVVAGKLYHLTLEAVDAGQRKIYEAKVFVKPWMNFKQLQEFKNIHDTSSSSDLIVKQDGSEQGWKSMRTSDPVVLNAAKQAVKAIQQRSNSLFPYDLVEILLAKSKVIREGSTGFSLVLSVRRGTKVEKMGVVVVNKDDDVQFGKFYLNQIYQVKE
ncbi:cysteine proteinase inhibitor 6-like [Impatiens glandulifera]|uniref:cysteine proteinase inhibitor 6-like n=1 Tax=Impatiens glandulifera TaxID=253017 RepID=UPI001FB07076|nr:cysteine proteinase inhibitor 6-like [Impatiens glandulifera]